MKGKNIDSWLEAILPKHKMLTTAVLIIIEGLLKSNNIDYLTVIGRTKDVDSIKEKVRRKSYKHPDSQLTDISGIRIIAYFESDVNKISDLIEQAFYVDRDNSLNKDELLAADQIGYRSVHYVCRLGDARTSLPEYSGLQDLKFEFQVRTVLQHSWAELAHDRNYKFSGKLPKEIERKLYLYAGMLEIADKGFDELSNQIDDYISELEMKASKGDYNVEINSISLREFVEEWAKKAGFNLNISMIKDDNADLIQELNDYGIYRIEELKRIIPDEYVGTAIKLHYSTTIFGLLRDWMLLHDYQKYLNDVSFHWAGIGDMEYIDDGLDTTKQLYTSILGAEKAQEAFNLFDPSSLLLEGYEEEQNW